MLINAPSKSVRHGKQQPRPPFNEWNPHDFLEVVTAFFKRWNPCSWPRSGTRLESWCRTLCLPSSFLRLFPLFWNPLCAACVFPAPLVWFGHIWHSCGLVNTSSNSVHLEKLPHTSLAVSDNPGVHTRKWVYNFTNMHNKTHPANRPWCSELWPQCLSSDKLSRHISRP